MNITYTIYPDGKVGALGKALLWDKKSVWKYTGMDFTGRQLEIIGGLKRPFPQQVPAFTSALGTVVGKDILFNVNLSGKPLVDNISGAGITLLVALKDLEEEGEKYILGHEVLVYPAPAPAGAVVEEVPGALTRTAADLLYVSIETFDQDTSWEIEEW